MSNRKPELVIDLIAPEGNAYALMAKAQSVLHVAGLSEQEYDLATDFEELAKRPESTYQDIRALAEKYCSVTWLNEYARFKEAAASTQEESALLSDALEALRLDLDAPRLISTGEVRERIQELRTQLDALEATLDTLPGQQARANS